jgi:hypothetical protein
MKATQLKQLILLGVTVLWLSSPVTPARAQVDIHVGIQLPPPLVFAVPPQVVILPETYVYVVPDIEEDVFFVDGWWWRPWQGHWYRSHYYDRGWSYYSRVPSFYREVPQEWRHEYRDHQWRGRPWNYEHMPHEQVEQHWHTWKKDKYWEQHQTWGVQGLQPQPRGHRQPPQVPQSQRRGQSSQAPQSQHRGQPPHVPQSQHHGQPPQAQKQHSSQPHQGQGHQGQVNQGHGQGNRSQGQRNAAKQHGGQTDK